MLYLYNNYIKSIEIVLKGNKGSTLVMSILITMGISIMGISLVAVTMSSVDMSIFYQDTNRAYFLAEAAAEEISKNIDQKVGAIQEEARAQATLEIQTILEENPLYFRESDGSISVATEEITFNASKLEEEFEQRYFEKFEALLDGQFSVISSLTEMKELLGTSTDDGTYPYKDLGDDKGRMVFKEAVFDSSGNTVDITIIGIFDDYEKKLNVKLDLLPETDKTPYNTVEKYSVKNSEKYDILKKAVVTEKNIIAAGGNVIITGDVLSFGTVPADDDTLPVSDRQEDHDADWYRYGGIMVGMVQNVASRSTEFDFDQDKTGIYSNGSLTINGNAATMGYIHTLYSTSLDKSRITITGDSFARSVRAERYSNYSSFNLGNLSVLDNLQIDSNATDFVVNGDFKGLVDTWHAIDGIGGGADSQDSLNPKRTSSVIVNGDSILDFNGAIYIGGSAFLKNYVDAYGNPYMTGISALKSTRRISSAFLRDDISNTDNKIYWYQGNDYVSPIPDAQFSNYNNDSTPVQMMTGRDSNPGYFPLVNRAMHFKGVWENLWENDDLYSSYVNPYSININTDVNGKLNGYSNGAIVANGKVYGVYEFSSIHDPVFFHQDIQIPGIGEYHNQVKGLLSQDFDQNAPRLDYVAPTKNIANYFDNSFLGINKIIRNTIYLPSDYSNKGFVYYGDSSVNINKDVNGIWRINALTMPVLKGFIYAEGDINIDDNFNFEGIIYAAGNIYINDGFNLSGNIMSGKNIVFLGNSNITYDESPIDNIINADVNINGLFGLLSHQTSNDVFKSQRTSTKNIKIIKWNEIK